MRVAFRTDASVAVGTGHLTRCLTLAEALRESGATSLFLCRAHSRDAHEAIGSAGFEVRELPVRAIESPDDGARDAQESLSALERERPDWLVVDHYGLDREWEKSMRPAVRRILVIDDLADRPHDCDALLDQNVLPDPEARYRGTLPPACVTWFGPAFILLRDEFRRVSRRSRTGPPARALVSFGGVDRANHTMQAIEALARARPNRLRADVVVGKLHPQLAALREACAERGFECHVQSSRMAELMARADIAIAASGFTAYELVAMALPAILVPASPAQAAVADELGRRGLAVSMSREAVDTAAIADRLDRLCESETLRTGISRACAGFIDGRGAERVAQRMTGWAP